MKSDNKSQKISDLSLIIQKLFWVKYRLMN